MVLFLLKGEIEKMTVDIIARAMAAKANSGGGNQPDLSNYVQFDDYATNNKTGVINGNINGFQVSSSGNPYAKEYTAEEYDNVGNQDFIGKGTLENAKDKIVGSSTPVQDLTATVTNVQNDQDESMPKQTASGEIVSVDDAIAYKTFNVTVDGASEQEITKGNQLIDWENNISKSTGISFSFIDDVLTVIGVPGAEYQSVTYDITDLIKNNPGKTINYSDVSHSVSNDSSESVAQIVVRYTDDTPIFYRVVSNYRSNQLSSYIIPEDTSNINEVNISIFTNNSSNKDVTNTVIVNKPLLYFDNNDEYEPYTGGQPSPSPDYPQEITTLTFDKITRCGKNLATENFANQNSSINLARTLKKGEKITIVVNMTATDNPPSGYGINIYDQDNEQLWGNSYANWQQSYDGWNSFVVTVKNDTSRLRINSYGYQEIEIPTAVLSGALVVENKYVNDGSLYEPYQGQSYDVDLQGNEMVEIPNGVKDELVIDKYGNVSLVKNVGKVVLNGSENWNKTNEELNIFYVFNYLNANGNYPKALSNYFNVVQFYPNKLGELAIRVNGTSISICSEQTSVEEFKSWLSTHNTILYYPLSNPQTIPLGTLSELITTINGTNNISINGNIPTTISTTYALDIKKYIDNKIAELSAQMIKGW